MRAKLILIASAAVMAAPAAASAETGGSQSSTAEASRDGRDASERPICRRVVATGSVMSRRVCRTRTEWDAITERSQADQRRTADQDRARSMTGVNGQ